MRKRKGILPWYLVTVLLGALVPVYAQWELARFAHITTEDGLQNNQVHCILQDRVGYMWFGTSTGLSRYDGKNFNTYVHDNLDSNSLSVSMIRSLYEDKSGTLWVGTERGLNRYIADDDRFEHFLFVGAPLENTRINSMLEDSKGRFWVGTYGNGLYQVDRKTGTFQHFDEDENDPNSLGNKGVFHVYEDRQGAVWVATYTGVNRFREETNNFERFEKAEGLSFDITTSFCEDLEDRLWVANWDGISYFDRKSEKFLRVEGADWEMRGVDCMRISQAGYLMISTNTGLVRVDPSNHRASYFQNKLEDPYSLSDNNVNYVFQDRHGVFWIGTSSGGVNKFDVRQLEFANFCHDPKSSLGLASNGVRGIFEGQNKNLWVATEKGLDRIDRTKQEVEHVPLDLKVVLTSVLEDHKGLIWVGTKGNGLVCLDLESGQRTRFSKSESNESGLSYDSVTCLLEDHQNNLWVGTLDGLNRMGIERKEFEVFSKASSAGRGLSGDAILSMAQGRNTLWIGTKAGLNGLDTRSGDITQYLRDDSRSGGLSDNNISSIQEAKDGSLWLGTLAGLNRMDAATRTFKIFGRRDGLPSEAVMGILEDKQGGLWVSTDKGLSHFEPDELKFSNYDVFDGLQDTEFHPGAFFKSNSGEMFFGGGNGLTAFYPSNIKPDLQHADVVITSFAIFNEVQKPHYQDQGSPLARVIENTERIDLNYTQDMISFEFAVLHYSNPSKNMFSYKLDGFDKQWLRADFDNPIATYTGLGSGTYTFRVKGGHRDHWYEKGRSLVVYMEPAPWLSWYAYTLYTLILLSLIYAYVRSQNRKLDMQREINENQNIVNERLRQLDKFKDEIMANTSHELRTPLNGIIGLADSLRDGSAGDLKEPARRDLATIVACGKRLSNLINDILDYSRLKNTTIKLNKGAVDLERLTEMVLKLSRPLLGAKGIKLIESIPSDLPPVFGDENRLMQILHNLVGNAIKFTEKGHVKVSAQLQGARVAVAISDTGIGIPEDKVEQVFEAFEQGDSSAIRSFGGTGLGLAITKKLVGLHGGNITIKTAVGVGTTFSFCLPVVGERSALVEKPMPMTQDRIFLSDPVKATLPESLGHKKLALEGKGSLLVVDDEPVNRQVLLNYLVPQGYRVVEASGGEEALQILSGEDFDIILLDLMMPRMSGYEVCRKIRELHPVNELPVIFLSAKNQTSDLLEGFVVGGNDYLAKPITKAELLARVNTHLELLDVNRNLERKVSERTQELEVKNRKIMDQKEELIRKQRQLVIQEKMASLGTLTAGIAHEINNPVNFAHGSVQNLVVDLGKFRDFFFQLAGPDADDEIMLAFHQKMDPLFDHSSTIMEGTNRISNIVRELQTFSRMDEADIKTVSLVSGIKSTLSLVKAKYAEIVDFVCHFDDPLEIECWPAEMNQVFMNLVINGCQAIEAKQRQNGTRSGEKFTITTFLDDGHAVVRFQDEGCGMASGVRTRIFEPFYTTKPVGEGTGLGLSITYEIITKHMGRIEVTSDVGVGTTLTMFLPLGESIALSLNDRSKHANE